MIYYNAEEFWEAIDRGEKDIELRAGIIKKGEILFPKIKEDLK